MAFILSHLVVFQSFYLNTSAFHYSRLTLCLILLLLLSLDRHSALWVFILHFTLIEHSCVQCTMAHWLRTTVLECCSSDKNLHGTQFFHFCTVLHKKGIQNDQQEMSKPFKSYKSNQYSYEGNLIHIDKKKWSQAINNTL